MGDEKQCPCPTVLELKDKVDEHSALLARSDTKFAVINTKLNFIIAVMSFLGAAFGGYLVTAMFK